MHWNAYTDQDLENRWTAWARKLNLRARDTLRLWCCSHKLHLTNCLRKPRKCSMWQSRKITFHGAASVLTLASAWLESQRNDARVRSVPDLLAWAPEGGRGREGSYPPDFEMWYFPINILVRKSCSLSFELVNEISPHLPLMEKSFWQRPGKIAIPTQEKPLLPPLQKLVLTPMLVDERWSTAGVYNPWSRNWSSVAIGKVQILKQALRFLKGIANPCLAASELSDPQSWTHVAAALGPIWFRALGPSVLHGCTPLLCETKISSWCSEIRCWHVNWPQRHRQQKALSGSK